MTHTLFLIIAFLQLLFICFSIIAFLLYIFSTLAARDTRSPATTPVCPDRDTTVPTQPDAADAEAYPLPDYNDT